MDIVSENVRRQLQQYRQEHVLAGWDRLGPDERRDLIEQIEKLDLDELQRLHARRHHKDAIPELQRLAPLPQPAETHAQIDHYRRLGETAFQSGEVAFLVVAGGQGTRLGFDHPKGMFPVGPVSGKSLFQLHAEKILALGRRYGKPLSLLVMTSPATHEETVAFFQVQRNFGFEAQRIRFFCQGTMPALDFDSGRLLLEAPGRLALSPNGHGGVLAALRDAGLFDELDEHGIRTIFYFQVDNALTNLADAVFLGRHLAQRAEASSKVLPKKHPKEKMGNFVLVDGRCSIIEYSDLLDEWATLPAPHPQSLSRGERGDAGLFFWGGNTAIHLFDVAFLRGLSQQAEGIPWHLAKKKVPFLAPDGAIVQPERENALKFERFIFDVLPLAERWTVEATTRQRDFEPLKNATGDDSPETVRRALIQQAATWLAQVGVAIPRDPQGQPVFPVEISPLVALDAEELQRKLRPGLRVDRPLYVEPSLSIIR
jgi:UDP-N-acetylglucosamine/UDP-N-acetylgalactosamine diphosphorylase